MGRGINPIVNNIDEIDLCLVKNLIKNISELSIDIQKAFEICAPKYVIFENFNSNLHHFTSKSHQRIPYSGAPDNCQF